MPSDPPPPVTRCPVGFAHPPHDFCDGNPEAKFGQPNQPPPATVPEKTLTEFVLMFVARFDRHYRAKHGHSATENGAGYLWELLAFVEALISELSSATTERDALENRVLANEGVGGLSADAPEQMHLSGFADHGCDAWLYASRILLDNGSVIESDQQNIDAGRYTQPVRYIRADVAESKLAAATAEIARLREELERMKGLERWIDNRYVVPMLCTCDLRTRQWDQHSGRCQTCGWLYQDTRFTPSQKG